MRKLRLCTQSHVDDFRESKSRVAVQRPVWQIWIPAITITSVRSDSGRKTFFMAQPSCVRSI